MKETQVEGRILDVLMAQAFLLLTQLHLEVGQVHHHHLILVGSQEPLLKHLRVKQGKDCREESPSSGNYADGGQEHVEEVLDNIQR